MKGRNLVFDNAFIPVAAIIIAIAICMLIFHIGYQAALIKTSASHRLRIIRDPLTGLMNRQTFLDTLERRIRGRRRSQSFCVAVVNVNRFRWVNDALGSEYGDRVITLVAEHIRAIVGEEAVIARLNGDEFAILVDYDLDHTVKLISRMIKRFEETPIVLMKQCIHILASAGIASVPEHGKQAREVLRRADTALSRARQSYSNVVVFEAYMDQEMNDIFMLATDLRLAIKNGSLGLVYQPRVCLQTGRVIAVEALARWDHPQQGAIPPGKFITIAENTGLIDALGYWVLEQSCLQAAAWKREGLNDFRISVNISVQQLFRDDFVKTLDGILQRSGLHPEMLELEITESVFIENQKAVTLTLETIKARGIRIAIDDFGKGYSSLNYLKNYPADTLKIDKDFIAESRSSTGQIITSSVIQLAEKLGLTVVAEGVEHLEQLEFLIHKGCDEVQGFLLSQPVTADDCKRFINTFSLDRLLQQLKTLGSFSKY